MRSKKKLVKLTLAGGLIGATFMPFGCNVSPELLSGLANLVLTSLQSNQGPQGGLENLGGGLQFNTGEGSAEGGGGGAGKIDVQDFH